MSISANANNSPKSSKLSRIFSFLSIGLVAIALLAGYGSGSGSTSSTSDSGKKVIKA